MTKTRYFLDYNSTTPLKTEAKEAMLEVMEQPFNPSSIHSFGRDAKKVLSDARNKILNSLGSHSASLIFTASGTESNNMALNCLKKIDYIACSAIEHVSLLKPAETKAALTLPVDSNGVIELEQLEEVLKKRAEEEKVGLVSVMHANNETGVIQPIKQIADLVFKYNSYLHVDASQSFGKFKLSFDDLGADLLTISAHKIGGPKGTAALILKTGLEVLPFIMGGGQEKFLRGGTENLSGIAGFAAAAQLATNKIAKYQKHCRELIEFFEKGLLVKYPEIAFFGANVERLANTSNFAVKGKNSETELIKLDLKGLCLSAGSACSSGRVSNSHVLQAMGVGEEYIKAALRLSIGLETKTEEIEKLIAAL